MIKRVLFENFRNISGVYKFNENFNVIFGPNNSGKTNILDGIKLAFSTLTNDYFKISKSDFKDSNDDLLIKIQIELKEDSIPSLIFVDEKGNNVCGFTVYIKKTQSGRYVKELRSFFGGTFDIEIAREDEKIPSIYSIPLIRIEDIYSDEISTGVLKFLESEEAYQSVKEESKLKIKEQMNTKITKFKDFCSKFNQSLDIELSDPKISNEKAYIVDGTKEHNYKIGSGYKSIANIIINTLDDNYNIILIDEIENHLHPNLIRTLIREIRNVPNTLIISTTHSAVVLNESKIEEIIDIKGKEISSLEPTTKNKLNIFLHAERSELLLADNIILVEGYSEELLLKYYLTGENENWTIVNVAGIMFEPYIELANLLDKKIVVISDNDKSLSDDLKNSTRFENLKRKCDSLGIKLIEVDNTLETDLYNSGYLDGVSDLLTIHKTHNTIMVAKSNRKTEIALKLIEGKKDLSNWHVIEELKDEFRGN